MMRSAGAPGSTRRGALRGSVVLLTGASSGIGRATAQRLDAAGARLVLVGQNEAALYHTARVGSGQVVVADLGRPGEPERVAAEALRLNGRVDVLVNNAGLGWSGPFREMDPDQAERLVAVNLIAPLRLSRALLPGMLAAGRGRIVNVSSIVGHTGHPGEAAYAATKAGLMAFTESLRAELAGTGVSATIVTPGVIRTPFFARRGQPYERGWPRPLPARRAAGAVVRAIREAPAEVFVPRWLTVPARLRGGAPELYRRLAARFG